MQQIWISKAGPPEVLVVKEAPDPQPAAGEMRIRVEASGVNFADVLGRLGLYPDLPRVPASAHARARPGCSSIRFL
jgi:NADPH:quinone reductase-like Zn-dependent oxidoreductase